MLVDYITLNYQKKKKLLNQVKIAILPTKIKKFTLSKAPMADKKNSHEHFKMKFFFYKLTFITQIKEKFLISSFYDGFIFLLVIKSNFPTFETNTFFLKSFILSFNLTSLKIFKIL